MLPRNLWAISPLDYPKLLPSGSTDTENLVSSAIVAFLVSFSSIRTLLLLLTRTRWAENVLCASGL